MNRFRSPVKREGAERYLLITLVSFAGSVVLTRLYLELTGYPQIGNGTLHIAHVLWGGLCLFIAALVPTIFANRWVYTLSALLGGIGVGLFIDEVGKFITQSSDYFFPFAAPIIYAFFLLTVMIYLEVRRPSKDDSRVELYHALDQIMELIENDLDRNESADLNARLMRVIAAPQYPEHARLAEALLAVLDSDTLHIVNPPDPNLFQRLSASLQKLEARLLDENRYRILVILGLAFAGVGSLIELTVFAAALLSPDLMKSLITSLLLSQNLVTSPQSVTWFLVLMVLSSVTGFMMVAGGFFIFVGRSSFGSELGYLGLLIALTMVNVLLFYFSQFAAVSTTIGEFALLVVLLRYRQLYLGFGSSIQMLNRLAADPDSSQTVTDE